MRFLHTMLRVRDLDAALDFFVHKLGLKELRRSDHEAGRYTLVFLGSGADGDPGSRTRVVGRPHTHTKITLQWNFFAIEAAR